MAATVMTVEFGTIHHYSSLDSDSDSDSDSDLTLNHRGPTSTQGCSSLEPWVQYNTNIYYLQIDTYIQILKVHPDENSEACLCSSLDRYKNKLNII